MWSVGLMCKIMAEKKVVTGYYVTPSKSAPATVYGSISFDDFWVFGYSGPEKWAYSNLNLLLNFPGATSTDILTKIDGVLYKKSRINYHSCGYKWPYKWRKLTIKGKKDCK